MEWLVVGLKISWEDLAADMGVDMRALREFKKDANVEGGGRHPTQTGTKGGSSELFELGDVPL